VTNEGRGWHLHLHACINSRFIDAAALAAIWAKLVGQDFSIVCVKDVTGREYIREISKYVVDGNQVAKWSGSDLAAYLDASAKVRTFGVFGSCFKLRAQGKAHQEKTQADNKRCECGCSQFRFLTPSEWEWEQQTTSKAGTPRLPTRPDPQLDLSLGPARAA
jgi:hypothetical protein